MKIPVWMSSSVLNTVAQLVRMACGLVVIKMIVIVLGTTGMGKLGYFMSVISMLVVFSGGGISNGIIKYVAEYQSDNQKILTFMSQALSYSLVMSFLIALVLIGFSKQFSLYFFENSEWYSSFVFIGISQFGFSLINFVNGVVNGLKRTKDYSIITIVGSVIGVIPAFWLTKYWGISGAVVALVFIQLGMLLPSFVVFSKILQNFELKFSDFKWIKPSFQLGKFSAMQLSSVAMMFLTEVSVRNLIVQNLGWSDAGIWQGVMRLSYAYIALFSSFLAVYYMPTISVLYDAKDALKCVLKTIVVVATLFFILAAMVYIFRNMIFSIILSTDFALSAKNLAYQLSGDLFRILSYVIGFFVVARANAKISILLELLQASLYISIAYFLMKYAAAGSVYMSYMMAYMTYFVFCLFGLYLFYKKNVRGRKELV